MTDHLELSVVTPAREVLRASVESAQLPGKDGYLGILPGHAPLITELGCGELSYSASGTTGYLTVMQGFAEVLPNRIIVLAEVSERPQEIDVSRAEHARDRAQQRLAKTGSTEVDWDRAAVGLRRALVRLQVAGKAGAAPVEPR